jgi:CheY-like chemotaxis protein
MTRPKILCVDDEVIGLRIRQMTLESQGYEVVTASEGDTALAAFADTSFDLVILDYSMPGRNGGEVALEMRRARPGVPIILLSAYMTLPPEYVGAVNMYLTKADPPLQFLSRVKSLLAYRTS